MVPKDPTRFVFSMLRDFYAVSAEDIDSIDPKSFIERLRGIHKGFSVEHEFAAIASWLGNARLIVQSDDVLVTDKHYRAPDFLIIARRGNRDLPFLVEVKYEEKDKIVWSEPYLASLRRFAQMLNLPLLIGWKRYGMWTLCDAEHLIKKKTAYHLTFDSAMKNNLMTMLFGNVFVTPNEGFRFELKFKLTDSVAAATKLLPEWSYAATIVEGTGLYTNKGKVPDDLFGDLFPVAAMRSSEPYTEREGEYLRQTYPVKFEDMFSASDLLFSKLTWYRDSEDDVNWLAAIRKGLVAPIKNLRAVLKRGIEVGAFQCVFEQQPQVIPKFLEGVAVSPAKD